MKQTPYNIEKLRDKLSKIKQYQKLKILYRKKYPEMKNLNTEKLWDKLNKKRNQDYPMAKEKIKIVTNLIPNSVIKILDIGFGSGDFERNILIKKHNFQLYGIDISNESVKQISKECIGIFKKGEATNLKFNKKSFDLIVALDIFEHIQPSKIFKVYSEVNKVLKDKSYLLLSVPVNENLEEKNIKKQNYSAHVREYTENIIKAELKLANFEIIKVKKLYAFKKMYKIKSFIIKIFPFLRKPNIIIFLARKI